MQHDWGGPTLLELPCCTLRPCPNPTQPLSPPPSQVILDIKAPVMLFIKRKVRAGYIAAADNLANYYAKNLPGVITFAVTQSRDPTITTEIHIFSSKEALYAHLDLPPAQVMEPVRQTTVAMDITVFGVPCDNLKRSLQQPGSKVSFLHAETGYSLGYLVNRAVELPKREERNVKRMAELQQIR